MCEPARDGRIGRTPNKCEIDEYREHRYFRQSFVNSIERQFDAIRYDANARGAAHYKPGDQDAQAIEWRMLGIFRREEIGMHLHMKRDAQYCGNKEREESGLKGVLRRDDHWPLQCTHNAQRIETEEELRP